MWEISLTLWHSRPTNTAEEFINAGKSTDKMLAHYDAELDAYDCSEIAAFFYITSEGTPGLLYLGVNVTDTNVIPGPSTEKEELNPKGPWKGRRFGLAAFMEVE